VVFSPVPGLRAASDFVAADAYVTPSGATR